ncbi:hypothetical protein C8R43DRAFT_1121700 [Mycena crocata]|nr:hypothetical protein C8R43DRAFT_1121700 [Mycena crocata]
MSNSHITTYVFLSGLFLLVLPAGSFPLRNSTDLTTQNYNVRAAPVARPPAGPASGPACPSMPSPMLPPVPDQVQDQYSVIFDPAENLVSHIQAVQAFITTNAKCSTINNNITLQINDDGFKYYSGLFDGRVLAFISASAGVKTVERVQTLADNDPPPPVATVNSRRNIETRREKAPWGLARITQNTPLVTRLGGIFGKSSTSKDWVYAIKDGANGKDVGIYIVDSGVNPHNELVGRVLTVAEAYSNKDFGSANKDGYGHGTAVVSVAAGMTVGVANQATIIPIRISAGAGIKRTDHIVQGINNAHNHYVIERER